jgi:hypothetical protein
MTIDLRRIPALYINLERDVQKNENMIRILNECGFKQIIRIEGIVNTNNPEAGCSMAHHKGVCAIKPPFILFEDDCQIQNFRPLIKVPDIIDALYLGNSGIARSNSHVGNYLDYHKVEGYTDLYKIYNMLSGHSVLYYSQEYVNICKRITHHAGYVVEHFQDWGFAEIQKWYNVYTFDEPFFHQTSHLSISNKKLTEYPNYTSLTYNRNQFRPQPLYDAYTNYPKPFSMPPDEVIK